VTARALALPFGNYITPSTSTHLELDGANKQQFSRTKMQQNYIICVAAITRELWPLAREVKGQREWQVAHKSAICMRMGIHMGRNVNMWIRMREWIRNEDVLNDYSCNCSPRSVNIFQAATHGNPFEKFADG